MQYFFVHASAFSIFLLVVDALGHAADDLHLIDRFDAHAEIFLDELGI